MACRTSACLLRTSSASKEMGGSIAVMVSSWNKMVGNHVAKGAGGFVEAAAMLDANGFAGGDLHVVDVITIPKRLDDVVRKAKDHQVLDGLFAEVVVDAIDLIFSENLFQVVVQLDGGSEVMTEGLFDDDASPVMVVFLGEPYLPKLLDDGGKEAWRDREIEEFVALGVVALVMLRRFRVPGACRLQDR